MARRPSKHLRAPRPILDSFAATQVKADGRWLVNNMSADRAVKPYICPGCQQTIPRGQAHLVAWPVEPSIGSTSPVAERRHWHTACWNRRP
ncbi:MAG: hypothetical protein LBR58_09405 [Propionibacteriaceae bacterium]|nr:hypothetical protein [Propionibacteriaceae bacterium]